MTHHSSQAQFRKELLCIERLNVSYLEYIFWMHLLPFYLLFFLKKHFVWLIVQRMVWTKLILNTNINGPAVKCFVYG